MPPQCNQNLSLTLLLISLLSLFVSANPLRPNPLDTPTAHNKPAPPPTNMEFVCDTSSQSPESRHSWAASGWILYWGDTCANSDPNGDGCTEVFQGEGNRIYLCGVQQNTVSCSEVAQAVQAVVKGCNATNDEDSSHMPRSGGQAWVGTVWDITSGMFVTLSQ